jgi:hypothetical protein
MCRNAHGSRGWAGIVFGSSARNIEQPCRFARRRPEARGLRRNVDCSLLPRTIAEMTRASGERVIADHQRKGRINGRDRDQQPGICTERGRGASRTSARRYELAATGRCRRPSRRGTAHRSPRSAHLAQGGQPFNRAERVGNAISRSCDAGDQESGWSVWPGAEGTAA